MTTHAPAQHTQGKWEARYNEREKTWQVFADGHVICMDIWGSTAKTSGPGTIGEQMEANARLIASAPALLAALEDTQRWLGKAIADGAFDQCVAPFEAERQLRRNAEAIAQARGQNTPYADPDFVQSMHDGLIGAFGGVDEDVDA